MANLVIGSARSDERGKLTGGVAGDSKQTSSTNDKKGEVSMQDFYHHSKGWYILRLKNVSNANKMAELMKGACNNKNLGYDQGGRSGVIKYGTKTTIKTECDCSSLVRQIIKEATGKDVGDFNTGNEATVLEKSGLFLKRLAFVSQEKTPVYDGDVLVTKTKGHTVIVVSGNPRKAASSSTSTKKFTVLEWQKAAVKDGFSFPEYGCDGDWGDESASVAKKAVVKQREDIDGNPIYKYPNLTKLVQKVIGVTQDGKFGPTSEKKLIAWQKEKGLTADGQCGLNTWKKMMGVK